MSSTYPFFAQVIGHAESHRRFRFCRRNADSVGKKTAPRQNIFPFRTICGRRVWRVQVRRIAFYSHKTRQTSIGGCLVFVSVIGHAESHRYFRFRLRNDGFKAIEKIAPRRNVFPLSHNLRKARVESTFSYFIALILLKAYGIA